MSGTIQKCRTVKTFAGLLLSLCGLMVGGAEAQPITGNAVVPPRVGISFSGLTGTNFASFGLYTEGDFAITPSSGAWFQGMFYGNPPPDILLGPVNSPGVGALLISDSRGLFTLSSFDFSSNNDSSAYDIQGFLGGSVAYHETGTLAGTFGPFSFSTLFTTNSSVAVDGLLMQFIPGPSATSINLDNIGVFTVPEPGCALLLGLGLAGLAWHRRLASTRGPLD